MRVMTVSEFANKNSLTVVALPCPEREIHGCYIGDLLSWVMGRANEDDAWITIMSNANTVAVASLTNVSCVILAENVTLSDEIVKTAKENGINVLSSPLSAFDTALMLSGVF